ncbi:hypothetical protein [Pseudoxanthomonas sp. UTMC 1351]|uniref:hypothetical protein n=1 Tax=Pseudoxanthomonas sp. UTMC 1351 TaxID=2695853 RepID=UPI0034CE5F82
MAKIAISAPSVSINNETLGIVPNSFTYDGGEGEISVRSASAGGSSAESVHAINAETMISKVTFELYPTPDLDARVRRWKRQIASNVIQITQVLENGDSIARTFQHMSLMNPIERNASADGTVSLEWSGDPMADWVARRLIGWLGLILELRVSHWANGQPISHIDLSYSQVLAPCLHRCSAVHSGADASFCAHFNSLCS